jgi:hypothetical protein
LWCCYTGGDREKKEKDEENEDEKVVCGEIYLQAFLLSNFEELQYTYGKKKENPKKIVENKNSSGLMEALMNGLFQETSVELMNEVWCDDEIDSYILNLRNYCRRNGFGFENKKMINRRYIDYSSSFDYYSQRLRTVGMSYDRTIFASAFLNDGTVDEIFIIHHFERTKRWLFDDLFVYKIKVNQKDKKKKKITSIIDNSLSLSTLHKNEGKQIYCFLDEIVYDLECDKTLTDTQRNLFLYYLMKNHGKLRRIFDVCISAFYYAMFILLILCWIIIPEPGKTLHTNYFESFGMHYSSKLAASADYVSITVIFVVLYSGLWVGLLLYKAVALRIVWRRLESKISEMK